MLTLWDLNEKVLRYLVHGAVIESFID